MNETKEAGLPRPAVNRVTLVNIARGSAAAQFDRELDRVIEDIRDLNKPAEKARKIVLEVIMVPANEERRDVDVEIHCTSKLPGLNPAKTTVFVGQVKGALIAMERDDRQSDLFDRTPEEKVAALATTVGMTRPPDAAPPSA